ncbi:NADH-quinone oxidoreductase subunit H [uncultured Phycicoccus sp.]|uniref:NADH-quinone oxidoreductase subunit H n=1 Tax=uncultured Phycicoccus sp. TaxID=661422 RepID=UPI00262FAECD|nr:NADH-quinone oxidoreductase subunit H [uncultured Phycicoccus sp.]
MGEAVTPGLLGSVAVAAALLAALATAAVVLDGVLGARSEGRSSRPALTRPVDEVARLLRQRRRAPLSADTLLWRIGGGGLGVAALLMVAVVPLGEWVIADLDVGVVWFNTMDVAVWALVWLTGWGANSVHSLVGGYRFLALALAYELPLMFALVAPAVGAASLDVREIAAAQGSLWFVVWMPVAFAVYCLGVVAFSVWGPFTPPAGSDVAGGVLSELSGVDRLLVQAGRYALLAAGAAFAVPMFLGGGSGPLLPGWAWVVLKSAVLLAALVWLRRRLPSARPDLVMEVGWVVLLPAVLLQDLAVAVVVAWRG